jgi:arylsulfatase A-like enzyme
VSGLPWLPILAAASYLVHLGVVHAMPGQARYQPIDVPAIAVGAVTLGLAQAAIGLAWASRPVLVAALRAVHLVVFWGLASYLYASHVPLDVAVLAANVEWPVASGAFAVLRAGLSIPTLMAATGVVAAIAWRDAAVASRRTARPGLAVVLAAVWVAGLVTPWDSYDETTRFARSGLDHRRGASAWCPSPLPAAAAATIPEAVPPLARAPDIVMVVIESLHAAFVGRRGEAGRPILPVFEGLAGRGLTVERFYAHAVQTAKGHFSLLAGVAPAVTGVEFERWPDLPLATLPSVLQRHGYHTLFVQGQADADFDNTRRFLQTHGIDRHEVAGEWLSADERVRLTSAWGTSDDGTYLAASRLWTATAAAAPRPVLLVVATVESHQPFSSAPGAGVPFGAPRSLYERYANALHAADAALGRFLADLERQGRLANALLIVTGDHAFPVGAHGLEHNEAGAYDEFFRVPFVLIDPRASTRRVAGPYGQIDIAPTLLARLGVAAPPTFQGAAIGSDHGAARRVVPLVQPYAGTFVGAVGERFKYLKHLRSGRERLVDLDADPEERANLWPPTEPSSAEASASLRAVADWLIANHCALERGQILTSRP